MAKAKFLSAGEETVAAADVLSVLKVTPQQSGMADASTSLESSSKPFTALVAISAPMPEVLTAKCNFIKMVEAVQKLSSAETVVALKRWGICLIKAETKVTGAIPESWKEKAVSGCDSEWIKARLFSAKLMTSISNHHNDI